MASKTGLALKAVVTGATGATGQCLVPELLKSPEFSQVTVVGRRRLEIDAVFDIKQEEEESAGRLKQVLVNFDEVTTDNGIEHFKDADVHFCCLGTTRAKAGSAENFRKIDYHLILKMAEIAKAANVRHMSLVSSTGASSGSMFLYLRTKGEVDDAVEKMDFTRTSIWRPGALRRYGAPGYVRLFTRLTMCLTTETLANALCVDAIAQARTDDAADDKRPTQYFTNTHIYAFTRQVQVSAESAAAAGASNADQAPERQEAAAAGTSSEPAAEAASPKAEPEAAAAEAPVSEPAAETPTAEPAAEAAKEEPVSEGAKQEAEEPAAEAPKEEPEVAATAPAEEPAAEAPATEPEVQPQAEESSPAENQPAEENISEAAEESAAPASSE